MTAANDENVIPKLHELAFEVFFDKIVYKSTPNTVQFVQDLIDAHLVGRVKYDIRRKCIVKMNKICDVNCGYMSGYSGIFLGFKENQQIMKKYKVNSEIDEERDVMDEFAQLNSVLDEHFEELTINTPVPRFDSLSTLLSIINRRSPNLKGLFISFLNTSYKLANLSPESSLIDQDFHLRFLTSLSMHHDTSMMTPITYDDPFPGDCNQEILNLVGKFCPALIKLKVTLGYPLKKKHLLGFILGEKTDLITDDARWNQDSVLVGLQIPPELLIGPICQTLQKLTLISRGGGHSDWFEREPNPVDPSLTPFVFAFVLRQFPNLRKIKLDTSITDLFKIIYNVKKIGIQPQQADFEETCRVKALKFGLQADSITSPTPFTCFSSIEKLPFGVCVSDIDTLRAISSLCPNLSRINLKKGQADSSYGLESLLTLFRAPDFALVDADDSPDEQLESILLREMSQVKAVSLDGLNPKFVKLVVNIFGEVLTTLDLSGSGPIDMGQLGICSKLEELSIVCSPINLEDVGAASFWTSETFLPSLTHFRTDACLGVWAPLMIERKCRLVDISIHCSHIATDAHNPRLEWSQVPSLWPEIESLTIWHSTGLTMTMVAELIPKLPKLRKIDLHESILAKDPELSARIIQNFRYREEPVEINELSDGEEILCAFLET